MKALIIEDEELAAERLVDMLEQLDPSIEVIGIIESVEDAVNKLSGKLQPDLIFMDIMLADGESFEIFDQVNILTPVIFITAYNEYAIRAFKVNSIDYLLKPIEAESLQFALAKFKSLSSVYLKIEDIVKSLNSIQLPTANAPQLFKDRFLVHSGDKFIPVAANEIRFFSYEHKLSFLHTIHATRYMLDQSMDELKNVLDPVKFFRLNRQYIVSFEAIKSVHNFFNGKLKVYLVGGSEEGVVVSRYRANLLKDWLSK